MWSCGSMAFDFNKFYEVGTHLKNHSTDEAYQRSSISRYYYSIFHSVKDYYEKSFRKTLSSQDSHSELIDALEHSPFKEENILGGKLRILRNNRNHSDYRRGHIKKTQIKSSKDKADEILSLLDYLIKNPLRLMNK